MHGFQAKFGLLRNFLLHALMESLPALIRQSFGGHGETSLHSQEKVHCNRNRKQERPYQEKIDFLGIDTAGIDRLFLINQTRFGWA